MVLIACQNVGRRSSHSQLPSLWFYDLCVWSWSRSGKTCVNLTFSASIKILRLFAEAHMNLMYTFFSITIFYHQERKKRFVWPFESEKRITQIQFCVICFFIWDLKWCAWWEAYSHWLHLYDFTPECILKCLFKSPVWLEAYSHWLHLYDFTPEWIFKWVFKLLVRLEA